MVNAKLNDIIELLSEIRGDSTTPKNMGEKIMQVITILKEDVDVSIKVNKALHELDEIVNDNNIQQYIRTQIWNAVSLLEKI